MTGDASGGPGALNLVKLCVGAESIEHLVEWRAQRTAERAAAGLAPRSSHRTRQTPRRAEELLAGGSLYWVIKGRILARQSLLAIEEAEDEPGVDLVFDPTVDPHKAAAAASISGLALFARGGCSCGCGPLSIRNAPRGGGASIRSARRNRLLRCFIGPFRLRFLCR